MIIQDFPSRVINQTINMQENGKNHDILVEVNEILVYTIQHETINIGGITLFLQNENQ